MKRYFVLLLMLVIVSGYGFSLGSGEGSDIAQVTADKLKIMMKEKNFTLINVHIPLSVEIPGTDLNIPYNKIEENVKSLPAKNDLIIVYCRSGSMSRTAYNKLTELGYTNILDLKGGYNAWESAGYQLMESPK